MKTILTEIFTILMIAIIVIWIATSHLSKSERKIKRLLKRIKLEQITLVRFNPRDGGKIFLLNLEECRQEKGWSNYAFQKLKDQLEGWTFKYNQDLETDDGGWVGTRN